MPSFLSKKQFTNKQANQTRLLTKVRWVIESGIFYLSSYFFLNSFFSIVNGQIKQWKYFSQTIQNSSIPFISDYLEIVCALINAFSLRPISDINSGSEMAFRMLEMLNQSNDVQMRLSKIVTERYIWTEYNAKMCPFPELDKCLPQIVAQLH